MSKKTHIGDELLIAFLLGETNEEQAHSVELWISESAENKQYFDDFEKTWNLSSSLSSKPIDVDIDKAWTNVYNRINKFSGFTTFRHKILPIYAGIAAMILLLVVFFIFYQKNNQKQIIVKTIENQKLIDTIPDGSIVELNKNSTITYSKSFNKTNRIVKLNGEAYFEVTKNKQKPFIVDADFAKIEVTGTKFNVNTHYDVNSISVFVEQGNVEITTFSNNLLVLGAGEKGIVNKSTGKAEKISASETNNNELFWKNKTLVFEGNSLADVAKTIEKSYNIEIIVGKDISNLKLSATFENESIEEVLNVISITFNLKITKSGNKYILDAQ